MIEGALNLEIEVAADNFFGVLILILDNTGHLILNIINIIIRKFAKEVALEKLFQTKQSSSSTV